MSLRSLNKQESCKLCDFRNGLLAWTYRACSQFNTQSHHHHADASTAHPTPSIYTLWQSSMCKPVEPVPTTYTPSSSPVTASALRTKRLPWTCAQTLALPFVHAAFEYTTITMAQHHHLTKHAYTSLTPVVRGRRRSRPNPPGLPWWPPPPLATRPHLTRTTARPG